MGNAGPPEGHQTGNGRSVITRRVRAAAAASMFARHCIDIRLITQSVRQTTAKYVTAFQWRLRFSYTDEVIYQLPGLVTTGSRHDLHNNEGYKYIQ